MFTTANQATPSAFSTLKLRKTLLYSNGLFLTVMGGAFALFDLLSYFWGRGPLGNLFYDVGFTVGMVEAHGLACIFGLLLLRAARREPVARWHLVGAAIHLLLGTSNLLFWSFIVAMNVVTLEIAVTTLHYLLFGLQLLAYLSARKEGLAHASRAI